jgi:hypothetical protein
MQIVLTLLFLAFMLIVAIKCLKFFLPELFLKKNSESIKVKQVGKPEKTPENYADSQTFSQPAFTSEENGFSQPFNDQPFSSAATSPKKSKKTAFFLIFTASVIILVYNNRDFIYPAKESEIELQKKLNVIENFAAEEIQGLKIISHNKVDGVNWFQIAGKTDDNELISGWFSEFSLKKEPAKESKAIDSISKKLGLPTTEERVGYIKKLKKVNSALGTALGKDKKTD